MMIIPETHDLDLVCVGDADPAPVVTWFKNGQPIRRSNDDEGGGANGNMRYNNIKRNIGDDNGEDVSGGNRMNKSNNHKSNNYKINNNKVNNNKVNIKGINNIEGGNEDGDEMFVYESSYEHENFTYIDNKVFTNLNNYNNNNNNNIEKNIIITNLSSNKDGTTNTNNNNNKNGENNNKHNINLNYYKIDAYDDTLRVEGVVVGDGGYYQCVVENEVGSVMAAVKVAVVPNGEN